MKNNLPAFFAIVFSFTSVFSDAVIAQSPLKVGVVLSGGGAKGYAHVGALKVLEEAGVRIDYIAGASMGAIVGGLYASGWKAAELDSILQRTDMTTLLQDAVPREIVPFFNKTYGEKYALSLSLQDSKINLPIALSDGQMAYNLLSQLTSRVAFETDFSRLPVPFFCTGTDVATGESVLMGKGRLPLAMRASGSFPGLLAPVEVGERLVADGGIVNNFPAKEMKNKGMDIVIGINVESDPYEKKELNSIEKIIMQISSFQMTQMSAEQYLYCDLLICPDIYGYGITSFEAVDTLVRRGELAAREVWDQLVELAQRQQEAGPLEHPAPLAFQGRWKIDSVVVLPNPVYTRANVLRSFPSRLPGEISEASFFKGIVNLYGTGNFRFVDYYFKKEMDGGTTLVLQPRLKPGYDRQLRVGLHYDDEYRSGLLLNATLLNLGFKNSITSVDVILGDQFRYGLHYYIDRGTKPGFGVNSRLHLNDVRFDLPATIELPDSFKIENLVFDLVDFSNEAYTHLFNGNDYAIGLAAGLKFYRFTTSQISGDLDDLGLASDKGWYLSTSAFYKIDNRDRRYFATNGTLANLQARASYGLPFRSDQSTAGNLGYNIDLEYQTVTPVSPRVSLGFSAKAGVNFGEKIPPNHYFLGGNNLNVINNFKPFLGLGFAGKTGTDLAAASVQVQRRFFKSHYLTLGGHAAYLKQAPDGEDLGIYSYSIGYGLDTPLGPIEATYGHSTEGDSFYFNLGYWF